MAILFVDSNGGAASSPFANWTDAADDIVTALADAACVAGSTVFVAHDHVGDLGTVAATYTNLGTPANPIKIICVNSTTGAYATTAYEAHPSTAYGRDIIFRDDLIVDGVSFHAGDQIKFSADSTLVLSNLLLYLKRDYGGKKITTLGADEDLEWHNVDVKFSNADQRIDPQYYTGGKLFWQGGKIDSSGTTPTYLIELTGTGQLVTTIKDVDLTEIATAVVKTLPVTLAIGTSKIIDFTGCKFPTSKPILESSSFSIPHYVRAHSCDTGDGYWHFEETYLEGQIVQDDAVYLAATYDGSNGYCAKMTSNANALDAVRPLRFKLWERRLTTANPTLTVQMVLDLATALQNDEIWLEVEYPDGTTQALRNTDRTSRQEVGWSGGSGPGTAADLTTSTETWTGTGAFSNEQKKEIAVTISGGDTGVHTVWICVAKDLSASPLYVDPAVVVT